MKYLKKYNEILQYYSDIDKLKQEMDSKKNQYKTQIENCIVYLTDEYIDEYELQFPEDPDAYDSFTLFLHSSNGIDPKNYTDFIDLLNRSIDMLKHELSAEILIVYFHSSGRPNNRNMTFDSHQLGQMIDIESLEGKTTEISIIFK